jgi:hypothetical protein
VPEGRRLRSARDVFARVPGHRRVADAWTALRGRDPLWQPPGHFYSPLTDRAETARDAGRIWPAGGDVELVGIDLCIDEQLATLARLAAFHGDLPPYGPEPLAGYRFRTENNMYGLADAAQLQGFIRWRRPQRIIEVGSGFSSAAALDAVEHFLTSRPQMTFIEPYPERLDALLTADDRRHCEVLVERVQDVPLARFLELQAGDILVIDSSHVSKTGSDVNHLFFEVLPRLASGVLVHLHDIGFPFEYPRPWVEEGRSWNEAYLLRAFLSFNERFRIALWNGCLRALRPDAFTAVPNLRGGSQIWLDRVG